MVRSLIKFLHKRYLGLHQMQLNNRKLNYFINKTNLRIIQVFSLKSCRFRPSGVVWLECVQSYNYLMLFISHLYFPFFYFVCFIYNIFNLRTGSSENIKILKDSSTNFDFRVESNSTKFRNPLVTWNILEDSNKKFFAFLHLKEQIFLTNQP